MWEIWFGYNVIKKNLKNINLNFKGFRRRIHNFTDLGIRRDAVDGLL
jgi:hypothetical protein